jgi:hypothetical protein
MAWARTRVALVFVLMVLDWWTPPVQAAGRHAAGTTVAARPEAADLACMPAGAYLDDDDDHHHHDELLVTGCWLIVRGEERVGGVALGWNGPGAGSRQGVLRWGCQSNR